MNWLIRKDPDAGKDWRPEEKGTTEDEMVGCHHCFNGHEFEQAQVVGDGHGILACCSPCGCRVGHAWAIALNWLPIYSQFFFLFLNGFSKYYTAYQLFTLPRLETVLLHI